ncbi:PilZ domain-containing protein [Luminiphilus sp.]|nr:PilZ domain-containing protein [Luminiphilus sp.]
MTDLEEDCGRGFFRIDDEIRLSWIKVEPNSVRTTSDKENELQSLNTDLHNLISTAFGDSAVLGEALGLLNRKIELLTGEESGATLDLKAVPVNVSGSGVAFASEEPLTHGETIELTMLLLTVNATARVRATVVTCSAYPEDDWTYWVRSKFEPKQEVITEQIVQHVNLRQMQNLASRNKGS